MPKVSIILPARNELYLAQTVDDLMRNVSDAQVIVVLDGYWPRILPKDDKRLVVIHREQRGMRASINAGVAVAKGKYILKLDAHCRVAPGFDEALAAECDGDWIVVPRRYSLDLERWDVKREKPTPIDYEYLGWPFRDAYSNNKSRVGLHAWVWDERIIERVNRQVDENMSFQGSCWFMTKEHFDKRLGGFSEDGYGTFIGEAVEIGLKTWLGGGKCMVNKKTWYAHLWKGQPYRDAYREEYGTTYTRIGHTEFRDGNQFIIDYWLNNRWPERVHDMEWLIDRFAPVPHWPEELRPWTH